MEDFRTTYHSKIYRDFRAIGSGEWRTIVRFYEECEADIRGLEFDEHFELLLAYTNALFETGSYRKHLLMADAVVEASVMRNVRFFNGEDVFHKALFKKAASCYHVREFEKADHILRELLRIDPHDLDAARFLKKCLRRMRPASRVLGTRALAVLLFLASACLFFLETMVVRSFYPVHDKLVEASRNTVFLLGCAVLVGGELAHRWRVNREVEEFAAQARRRKKR